MKRHSLLLFSILYSFTLLAQNPDFRFGEIPAADLSMTIYEKDTTADAVILEAYGYINVEPGTQYPLKQTFSKRIKILKESAIEREGDLAISYYSKDGGEYIKDLTVSIQNEGEKEIRVTKKDAFVEEVNAAYSIMKLSLPNIKVGTVIEVKYYYYSQFFVSPDRWYFQRSLPVRRSVIEGDFSKEFNYTYLLNVDNELKVTGEKNGERFYKGAGMEMSIKDRRFTMLNIPAFKKGEPYVTAYDDYIYNIKFQLSQYRSQGELIEYMSSWDLLAKGLVDEPSIGMQYLRRTKHAKLLKAASSIVYAEMPEMEKLQALYDFVNNAITDVVGVAMSASSSKIDQAYLAGKANSAEMNLMLKALLNEAGIKSKLMFVSTRNRGRAIEVFPIMSQFNCLMLYVTIDDENYMVDAGNPLRPIGFPRRSALNKRGWIASRKSNEWIDIKEPKGVDNLMVNITIDVDGEITGTIKGKYTGYNALPERAGAKESKGKGTHWKERFTDKYPDIEIEGYKSEHLDNVNEAFLDEFQLTAPAAAMVTDDHIYFQPIMYSTFSKNVLKSETRNYPVDFNHPMGERSIWVITIPEGYKVEELPESRRFLLPNKAGSFTFASEVKADGTIQVLSKLDLKQTHFSKHEYKGLRELFSVMEEKMSEQIVLIKK